MNTVLSEIIGPDVLIVLVIIALLFGGAKLPKLARSLGSAKGEFEKGLRGEGDDDKKSSKSEKKDADATDTTSEPKAIEPKAIEARITETKQSSQT